MKRLCKIAVYALTGFALGCLPGVAVGETRVPSRTINLVYDDSGSMIRQGNAYVDTWCQAKYALEVVAAMLDERDTLNVYYMSDYDTGTQSGPRITLRGGGGQASVDRIHSTITSFGNTPFNAVRRAHADLKKARSDERWLVVLTDGAFEDGRMESREVVSYFESVTAGDAARVMMLAMGPEAASIEPQESRGIYFYKAASSTDILPKLTELSNRIFQRNALTILQKGDTYRTEFAVPMKQLIVFAQGPGVDARIAMHDAQSAATSPSSQVHVVHSTQSSVQNPPGAVVASNLNGVVATFDGPFAPGAYMFDVSGAESLDVYYKPNVAIRAYLHDADGRAVTDDADIVNGRYRLTFGFVDADTAQTVTDTSLLGDIDYQATLVNTSPDGTQHTLTVASGDEIELREGRVAFDVTAKFLDYNTVRTHLDFEVFYRANLLYQIQNKPTYRLTKDGLINPQDPIVVTVALDEAGTPLSAQDWADMPLPEITMDAALGGLHVEKSATIGEFLITPELGEIDPFKAATGNIPFAVRGEFHKGKSSAAGRLSESFEIQDDISSLERTLRWIQDSWRTLLAWMFAAFFIIGYLPGVKKRFSKKIPSSIPIKGDPVKFRGKSTSGKGIFQKDILSILLPYKAETGSVVFRSLGIKSFRLKAGSGSRVFLENAQAFKDNKNYDFSREIKIPFSFGINTQITVKTDDFVYRFKLQK